MQVEATQRLPNSATLVFFLGFGLFFILFAKSARRQNSPAQNSLTQNSPAQTTNESPNQPTRGAQS